MPFNKIYCFCFSNVDIDESKNILSKARRFVNPDSYRERRRVAVNLCLLDESKKPLVFFGNESYKYKESVDIVLTKSFCFFLFRKKKVTFSSKNLIANINLYDGEYRLSTF